MNSEKIERKLADALTADTGVERYSVEVATNSNPNLEVLLGFDQEAVSVNVEVHGAEYFTMSVTKAQIEALAQLDFVTLVLLVGTRILKGRSLKERIERDRFFRSIAERS